MNPRRMLLAGLASACVILSMALLFRGSRETIPIPAPPLAEAPPISRVERATQSEPDPEAQELEETSSPPAMAGTVRGHIYRFASPTPAPGAHVEAFLDGVSEPVAASVADESGEYELTPLPAGVYRISAWGESLAQAPLSDSESTVELEPGESISGVDRTLVDGCRVAGLVLREDTREPIPGAIVDFEETRFARSGADGSFRLDGIRPGLRDFTARAAGFIRNRVRLEVRPGEEATVDFELAPGGAIEGRVTLPDGQPCPAARVSFSTELVWNDAITDRDGRYTLDGVPLETAGFPVRAALGEKFETEVMFEGFPEGQTRITLDIQLQLGAGFSVAGRTVDSHGTALQGALLYVDGDKPLATSDEAGRFRIEGVTSGRWTLTARKPGLLPASLELPGLRSTEERESIELTLEPGHFVEGKVVDRAGRPIDRAWVAVDVLGNDAGPYPSTHTDTAGRFRLDELPLKFGGIAAAKSGYCERRGIFPHLDARDAVIVLEEGGRIDVRVVEKGPGTPVPRFTVKTALADIDSELARAFSTEFQCPGLQGRDGTLRITSDLAPQVSFKLLVEADGFAERIVEVEPWPVSVRREPVRIELERGMALLGRVTSGTTGEPVAGVRVRFVVNVSQRQSTESNWFEGLSQSDRLVQKAKTDAGGGFEVAGVSGRPGDLFLERKGFARTVVAGVKPGPALQTFALPLAAAVEGSVTTASGEPAAGVGVGVRVQGQGFPATRSRGDGRYRIDDLPAGEANVWFNLPPRADGSLPLGRKVKIQLRAGETSVADFVIATGSIAGVLTRRGRPLAGAFVGATYPDGDSPGLQTDLKGRFHFSALPSGSWTVRVDSVRDGDAYRDVGLERAVVVGAGETRCDIDLAATIVSGRVLHAKSGEPVMGAHVRLLDADGALRAEFQCAPASDRFELEAPGSGTFWVAAATANAEAASGWIGPITLEEGVGRDGVVVPIGGSGELTASVLEARTGRKLERARVRIVSAGSSAFSAEALTDSSGQARLGDLPPGAYQLAVETDEHVPEVMDLEIFASPVDRTVVLEPASRITLDVSGDDDLSHYLCVEATCLSGGDPGWSKNSAKGGPPRILLTRPAGSTTKISLWSRPGSYRIRFVVMSEANRRPDHPLNPVELQDVTVPPSGETTVHLAMRLK